MKIWKPEDTQEPDLERDGEITTFETVDVARAHAEWFKSLVTPDVQWFDFDWSAGDDRTVIFTNDQKHDEESS